MKTEPVQQSVETATETVTQERVYQKPARDVDELNQRLSKAWSENSTASLIKRLINGEIARLKSKSKH